MGFGVVHVVQKKMKLLDLGVLALSKIDGHPLKLKEIFERTILLIETHKPDELAIESPFFGVNVQSMLKLGRAQGVAIAAALSRDIPYVEYAPKKVKQSVTGNGNASKEQVASMLVQILKIQPDPKMFDATDALSVALCHHYQKGNNAKSGAKSWKGFLTDNPDRVASK